MATNLTVGLTAALLLVCVEQARAQDCSALLSGGVFDISSQSSEVDKAKSFASWFCDQRFSSQQEADSFGADLGFPFKGIPVNIGIDYGSSDFKIAQSMFCKDIQSNYSMQEKLRNRLQSVSPIVVQGFNQCISSKGVHAWIERSSDPKKFILAMRYNPFTAATGPAEISISLGKNVLCDPMVREIVDTVNMACERIDGDSVLIAVNSTNSPVIGGGKLALPKFPLPPRSFFGFLDANGNSMNYSVGSPKWLNTGILVETGDSIQIKASGEAWYASATDEEKTISRSGPNGHPYSCQNSGTGMKCGALVASIGNGPLFLVGEEYSGFSESTGQLWLAYEDIDSGNNLGGYSVSVSVSSGY